MLSYSMKGNDADVSTASGSPKRGFSSCHFPGVPEIFQHGKRALHNFWTDEAEVEEVDQVDEEVARQVLLQDLHAVLLHKLETGLGYLAVRNVAETQETAFIRFTLLSVFAITFYFHPQNLAISPFCQSHTYLLTPTTC